MEVKSISNETLERVKTLPRIDYEAFKSLIRNNQVKQLKKLKSPRTIFFDEITQKFLYLNPFHCELHSCGEFI